MTVTEESKLQHITTAQ